MFANTFCGFAKVSGRLAGRIELLCKRRVNGRMKCTLQRQKTEYAYSFNVLTYSKIVLDINSIKKYCIPHSIEISSTTALKKIHSRYLEAKVS